MAYPYVCILFETAPVARPGSDPRCEHTPAPVDYNSWHAWAERMSKMHRQLRCRWCGLFAVWVPKPARRRRAA